MDVRREFSTQCQQLLLLALNKNNAAGVYIIALFDDYTSVKAEIEEELQSRFK